MTEINLPEVDRFHLKQTYLLLTRQCNLSCSHCIRSSDPYQYEYVDTNLALQVLNDLSETFSDSTMIISGGEPTLHRDFGLILRTASERFRNVIVNTNGINIKRILNFAKSGQHNGNITIQVSLDGDQQHHDHIRGNGTFTKSKINIAELKKAEFKVCVSTTVNKDNADSVIGLDKALKNVPFKLWSIRRAVSYGRANSELDLSTSEWNRLTQELKKDSQNKSRLRVNEMYPEQEVTAAKPLSTPTELANFGSNCGTGRAKLYINPNGTVYPCACMEESIVGDFNDHSFETIKSALSSIKITPKAESVCRSCPSWNLCQGGCPGASQRDMSLGDPRCPLVSIVHYKKPNASKNYE